jgi:hypothetical protein
MFNNFFSKPIPVWLAVPLLCIACSSSPPARDLTIERDNPVWLDDDTANVNKKVVIDRGMKKELMPTSKLVSQSIFIKLKNSPKVTKVLQDNLKSRGFKVSDSEKEAEAVFILTANYKYTMGLVFNLELCSTDLGKVLESSGDITSTTQVTVPSQAGNLATTGMTSAVYGATSAVAITSAANLLVSASGFGGFLDKLIFGDERGICLNENCRKQRAAQPKTSAVSIQIHNGQGQPLWTVYGSTFGIKPLFSHLVPIIFDYAIQPITDLIPLAVEDPAPVGSPQ